MKLTARQQWAKEQAEKAIQEHLPPGWLFRFLKGHNTATVGLCSFMQDEETGIIWLAPWLADFNDDSVILDVILHEVAHGSAWVNRRYIGHGEIWKQECRKLGCRPERLIKTKVIRPKGRYTGTCVGCRMTIERNRLRKEILRYYCGSCGPTIGKITWVNNSKSI